MKKIIIITALLVLPSVWILSQTEGVRFAVSPFVALTVGAENEQAGVLASGEVEKGLSNGKWFELRKKGEIEGFLEKLAFAQAGAGNPDEVAAMGKNLKINYLTVGSVSKLGSLYEVDSRSVDINNWIIVHSAGCSAIDIESAANYINKDVDITLTRENLDGKRSSVKDKSIVAVYRFSDANLTSQEFCCGGTFAEILNSELACRGGLAVMERTHLKAVIDAKQLEMCGIDPNDDSDKAFSVRGIAYKFEGTIKTFPEMICISYRVINTATNRRIYMGYSEIASVKGLRPLSRKIARDIDDAINNKIGTVEIKSVPSGASLTIDGQPYGKTPVIVSLVSGSHNVKVALQQYETVAKDITVIPSKISAETIRMQKVSLTLFNEAFAAEQKKDWKGAVAKYDEFINKYGDTEDANQAFYRKGHVLLLYVGDKSTALKTFESLVARYPDSTTRAEAYFGIARAYKELGNSGKMNETVLILRDKFPNEIATEEAKTYFGFVK